MRYAVSIPLVSACIVFVLLLPGCSRLAKDRSKALQAPFARGLPAPSNRYEPSRLPVAPSRKDLYGNPLPIGAIARMGSGRSRHGAAAKVISLSFSPDAAMLASQGVDDTIRLWEIASGRPLQLIRKGTSDSLFDGYQVVFTHDGRLLVSGGDDHTIRLWESNTGREVLRISLGPLRAPALAVSPDDRTLAVVCTCTGLFDPTLHTWSLASGKELQQWKIEDNRWQCPPSGPLAYSPDGSILALGHGRYIHLWQASNGKTLHRLSASAVRSVAFSPDGRLLASCGGMRYKGVKPGQRPCYGAVVQLWEVETGKELLKIDGFSDELIQSKGTTGIINCVAFAPDGQLLATVSDDGSVRLWEAATGKEFFRYRLDAKDRGSLLPVLPCVAFSPDGRTLASGMPDGTALVWEVVPPGWDGSVAKNLRQADLDELWADLARDDAAQAYRAIWTLSAAPDQAVAFLQTHLPAVPHEDDKNLAALIADLDNDDFAMREAVTRELIWLGPQVEPALRRTLANNPSPEVRGRIEGVLPAHHSWGILPALENLAGPRDAATLCSVRAIWVLQRIGTPEARALLERLAAGDPQARPTREAQAALARLNKKPRPR